jgi:hypothetical protein
VLDPGLLVGVVFDLVIDRTLQLQIDEHLPDYVVTPSARDNLTAFGHLRDTGERFPVLHDLWLGGRPLAPLPVRVNAAVARITPEGMLGLNFLGQFREIHFDTETGRLTLQF